MVDDRLLTMGRLYYDVVSEMAALKGEVVPPATSQRSEARAAERAARDAKAEAAKSKENEENEEATTWLSTSG